MMFKALKNFQAIVLLALIVFAGQAAAQVLRPARTVYDLKLDQNRNSPGIDSVSGRLVIEFMEDCGGFIFNQGFITDITSSEGPNVIGDMQASLWESRDGRAIRFNLLNRVNGKIVEREEGRADVDTAGAGNAVWRLPKTRDLALPAGTMFPINHSRVMLEHALRGSRGFEIEFFDGSFDAGYYFAAVFIGDKMASRQGEGAKLLAKDLSSWPIRLAYYHHDDRLGLPAFEVGFTMYSDGVVDNLTLDYAEFGLTGRLVELEYYNRPTCD